MKVFHYPKGHKAGETLTVSELRQELLSYPPDMPVMATWEGVQAYIHPTGFSVDDVNKGKEDEACKCLLIDVEAY